MLTLTLKIGENHSFSLSLSKSLSEIFLENIRA